MLDDTCVEEVEREVAGARADLQRARIRARLRAQQLRELAEHLRLADPAEVDAPLGVVVVGRHVVVAAGDVEGLVGGGGGGPAGGGGGGGVGGNRGTRGRLKARSPPSRPRAGALPPTRAD